MKTMSRVLVALVCLLGPATAAPPDQIPDKFTNLQVLPQDASRADVVAVMRSFAGALGVRCNHCHVGENPATLENYDFASDAKETKKVARGMMRMTGEINGRLVPAAGVAKPLEVRCITCHRGLTKPEQLLDILTRTAEQRSPAAALDEYRDLRLKYYGRGGYDFGAPTLNMLAEGFARRKDVAAAIEVQEFNVKVNPDIATSYGLLGDLYLAKGDRDAARGAFERAVALDPSSAFFKKRLDDLRR